MFFKHTIFNKLIFDNGQFAILVLVPTYCHGHTQGLRFSRVAGDRPWYSACAAKGR
jgi:hypothetical protein